MVLPVSGGRQIGTNLTGVQGQSYAPGGATSWGLFGGGGGAQPPHIPHPPVNHPPPTAGGTATGNPGVPLPPLPPPTGNVTGGSAGMPTGTPQAPRPMGRAPQRMPGGTPGSGLQQIGGTPQAMPAPAQAPAPMQVQQAPQPVSGPAQASTNPAQDFIDWLTGQLDPTGQAGDTATNGAAGAGAGGAPGSVPNPADVLGPLGGYTAEQIASALQQWNQGWDQGMGGAPPGQMQGLEQILAQYGFNAGGLGGDVAQQWATMMDPGAWQQRADLLMQGAQEQGQADMNLAGRRLHDQAGRSGLANSGGAQASIYNNYGRNMQSARRNIATDALGMQMQATQGAGAFANQQQALDQQRWMQALGMLGGANAADTQTAQGNYLGFGEALGGLLGVGGDLANNVAQGAGQGGADLASLLPLLPLLLGAI